MSRWWDDQGTDPAGKKLNIGSILREMIPKVFPGVPAEAILGYCATGNITENTTEGVARQKFHEIGLFGTEAGLRNGPAPNPDPNAPYNQWGILSNHPRVRQLLCGRPATMKHNGWKNAIPDQTAVGLVNLLEHGRNMAAHLDASIRPDPNRPSLFFIACCFMGWSAGDGRAAKHIDQFKTILSGIPEQKRWGAFLYAVANGIKSGRLQLLGQKSHNNVAYSAQRTWQKLAAGQLLAQQTGGRANWFDTTLGADESWISDTITCTGNFAKYGSELLIQGPGWKTGAAQQFQAEQEPWH